MITQNISIDFIRDEHKIITVKQYDNRSFNAKCVANGIFMAINETIFQCNVKFYTANGKKYNTTATINENNFISFELNEEMLSTIGISLLELELVNKKNNTKIFSSIPIIIKVEKSI